MLWLTPTVPIGTTREKDGRETAEISGEEGTGGEGKDGAAAVNVSTLIFLLS